ncbi:MAG: hypothetical protein PF488_00435 [Patescibacteria group bacterium]|jgi:hypothetical protein|nr:hypothetical protein [Patescibacteria group bacterium]
MKLYNFFKKFSLLSLFLLASFLLVNILPVKAASEGINISQKLEVEEDQIIEGNVYSTSQDVVVNGVIVGDLIAISNNITINGDISGDLIAVATNININGTINGNLRVAAENINISGKVNRNITSLSTNINLEDKSFVGWDLLSLSEKSTLSGSVNGNLNIYSNNTNISGDISKDANITFINEEGSLNIDEKAQIGGNLKYKYFKENTLKNQGLINGEIFKEIKTNNRSVFLSWFLKKLFLIFAALAIGLVLIYLFKNFSSSYLDDIKKEFPDAILYGAIAFFATPIAIILLLFTLIGIPLSLIILLVFLTAICIAKIITALFLGRIIYKKIFKFENIKNIWPLITGVFILWFSFSIPYVGRMISFISIIIGLGLIINYVKNKSKNI